MVAASEHIALAPIAPRRSPPGPCAVSILPQFFDRARATTAPEQRDAPHPKSRRPVLSSRAAPTELLSSLAHLTTVAGRALPSGGYFGRQMEIEVRSPASNRLRERLVAFRATILRRRRIRLRHAAASVTPTPFGLDLRFKATQYADSFLLHALEPIIRSSAEHFDAHRRRLGQFENVRLFERTGMALRCFARVIVLGSRFRHDTPPLNNPFTGYWCLGRPRLSRVAAGTSIAPGSRGERPRA